jgi:hypothetical protein
MDNFYQGCPAKMADGRFLTDYRSPNVREQYIRNINNIGRVDDYRSFLQSNAERIMDTEWSVLQKTQTCQTNCCIHKLPLRTTPSENYKEIQLYNNVALNKVKRNVENYPKCEQLPSYRLTHTKSVTY